jgi:(p)ppGpp synthase/HD superfamily hydrolase
MTNMASIAESIAREAHAGVLDKIGEPYIAHIERVVSILMALYPEATKEEVCAAWLHDVLEDTNFTKAQMEQRGISNVVIEMVESLSRPEGSVYLQWIRDLAATRNTSLLRVKLSDNKDNQDTRRNALLPGGKSMIERRYQPAQEIIMQALLELGDMPKAQQPQSLMDR